MEHDTTGQTDLDAFWQVARVRAKINDLAGYLVQHPLEAVRPQAWAFGSTPEMADELLRLVLDGTKTATSSALWDYEAEDEEIPTRGELSILLDGREHPRALIVTTEVEVRPFDEVGPEHAAAEGEGDRSLAHWREVHERFFTTYAAHGRGFAHDMPVVLESFKLLYVA